MEYTYSISDNKNDKLSTSCLFSCHTLNSVLNLLITTFFIAYIYNYASSTFDYIKNVGIYYLAAYITFLIFYYIMSYIVDKTNRVWIYRIAWFVRLITVIIIIFQGRWLSSKLILAGFLFGLSEALYYVSYNIMKLELVSRKNIEKYATMLYVFDKVVNIIVPITLGAIIDIQTYETASIYVAIIGFVAIVLTFFIRSKKPKDSKFNLHSYIKKLKTTDNENTNKIKLIYLMTIFYGLTTMTTILLNVCIMFQFGTSFSLGTIKSIVALISMISIILIVKFTIKGHRSWMFYISIAMPIISSLLFIIHPSVITVIIYNILMGISYVIYNTIYDVYRNSNLKEAGLYSEIAEHNTIVESIMTFSRIFSFGLMILIGMLNSEIAFKMLLVIYSSAYSIVLILLYIYEIKYFKNKQIENK